jgi:hypothetical protein
VYIYIYIYVQRHAPDLAIVLYDLGLNDMERDAASAWVRLVNLNPKH